MRQVGVNALASFIEKREHVEAGGQVQVEANQAAGRIIASECRLEKGEKRTSRCGGGRREQLKPLLGLEHVKQEAKKKKRKRKKEKRRRARQAEGKGASKRALGRVASRANEGQTGRGLG
jgi:hypothetical protein